MDQIMVLVANPDGPDEEMGLQDAIILLSRICVSQREKIKALEEAQTKESTVRALGEHAFQQKLESMQEAINELIRMGREHTDKIAELEMMSKALQTEWRHGASATNDNRNDISVLAQHQQIMRDKLHALALIVGALDNQPVGSLRWAVDQLYHYGNIVNHGEVLLRKKLENYKDEPWAGEWTIGTCLFPQLYGGVDTGDPEEE